MMQMSYLLVLDEKNPCSSFVSSDLVTVLLAIRCRTHSKSFYSVVAGIHCAMADLSFESIGFAGDAPAPQPSPPPQQDRAENAFLILGCVCTAVLYLSQG